MKSEKTLAEILLDESKIREVSKYYGNSFTEFQYDLSHITVKRDFFMYPVNLRKYMEDKTEENKAKKEKSRKSYIERWNKVLDLEIWKLVGQEIFKKFVFKSTAYMTADISKTNNRYFALRSSMIQSEESEIGLIVRNNEVYPELQLIESDFGRHIALNLEAVNKFVARDAIIEFIKHQRLIGYTCIYLQTGDEHLHNFPGEFVGQNNIYYIEYRSERNGFVKCGVFRKDYWYKYESKNAKDNTLLNTLDKSIGEIK